MLHVPAGLILLCVRLMQLSLMPGGCSGKARPGLLACCMDQPLPAPGWLVFVRCKIPAVLGMQKEPFVVSSSATCCLSVPATGNSVAAPNPRLRASSLKSSGCWMLCNRSWQRWVWDNSRGSKLSPPSPPCRKEALKAEVTEMA